MSKAYSRRISRSAAFAAQGVALKYPAASWSGVRSDDRMVVFAIHARDVLGDHEGFSCALWTPARGEFDSPARRERLEHCRLALQCGGAEGLLAYGETAEMDPAFLLSMRLDRQGREYWARWGTRASAAGARDERQYQALAA